MSYSFELKFKVRDYECDLQGIVNNSVYLNYLEHTRHEFLLEQGVCFSSLAQRGIHLVVSRIELDYKKPLKSKDEFVVKLSARMKGKVRGEFLQSIHRCSDDALIVKACVQCVALNEKGQPFILTEFSDLFEPVE
jgi:acyl-CoA thioester hydrolase